MFVPFVQIATVSLGFKSLQNKFFYVNEATIDTYGIEKRFLMPILMLGDLDATSYEQDPVPRQWLFHCREKERDLRGSGALRYIEAMADVSAAEKKQTGKPQTIRQVLEAQSGGLWYAPKARPSQHNVWIRKAFDGVFAPFVFKSPALVDQRCNSISPAEGISWEEAAAALTPTLFAYSVEINGSISMGAGVLEAPTTKIRSYPVLDVRSLKKADRQRLVTLARAAWRSEAPVDWSSTRYEVGKHLRALDQWIGQLVETSVPLETLYADLHEVCQSRIGVAKDKIKKSKKRKTENIGNVADAIAKSIAPKVKAKSFPEDFLHIPLDTNFHVSRELVKSIQLTHFMDQIDITLLGDGGTKVFESTYAKPVAEAIAHAILWGRSSFRLSSDAKAMDASVRDFIAWTAEIRKDVNQAIADSALGTGYEEQLRREVFRRLGVNEAAGSMVLASTVSLA